MERSIFGRSLRPCWDVILSILRDSELFDAERLFACVLGIEPGKERVTPRGPYPHTVIKDLAPTQDPNSRFFRVFDVSFRLFQ